MIQNKIELRNEDQITKESLRDLCDAVGTFIPYLDQHHHHELFPFL